MGSSFLQAKGYPLFLGEQSLISGLDRFDSPGPAYLLADRIEDARACVDRALMVARERGARGDEAYALRLLGEITSRGNSPDPETADTYYQQAMALGEELGIRPLVAHCHLGLGRLYLRTGKQQHAQEHLAAAIRMFHEMDMGFWLERAEAEKCRALGKHRGKGASTK